MLLPPGLALRPVGWLGNSALTSGPVPDAVVDNILRDYQTGAIFSDGTLGWHDCELCPGAKAWYKAWFSKRQVGTVVSWRGQQHRIRGKGHYLLRHGTKVYMAPALLIHYILDHSYRPPDEFTDAVLHGSFLRPDDLEWAEFSPSGHSPPA